jgi:hypothetical protein
VLVAAVALSLAAACLAGAAVLDSPALGVAGALLVLLVFGAREGWMWRGRGRQWLVMMGGLLAVILVAFVAQKLFG